MSSRIVFSAGSWVSIRLPVGHDPAWTSADKWLFATVFAAAKQVVSAKRAEQVAEAVVSKRLYPGLCYSRELEGDIERVVWLGS